MKHYDLRAFQSDPPVTPKRKHLLFKGKVVQRDPAYIDSIVIHQTACVFGVTKLDVSAALGDKQLATARRALRVACHALAFDGFFASPNPLRSYVWHGNGFNPFSLGLEIEGFYSGLRDDPDTIPREDLETIWRGPPMHLTPSRLETAKAALKWLIEEGRREGMFRQRVRLLAHRQSSDSRRSDPGEEPWSQLVEWARRELGCETDADFTDGSGRPLPKQWDRTATARY